MSCRFSGTTARKCDERPEPSRRALLAKDREIRRLQEWRHAADDTWRFIAAVIRDEEEQDPTWSLEQISAAIARWERAA